MNKLWPAILMLLSSSVLGMPLSELIDKNVQSATRAYQMTLPVAAAIPAPTALPFPVSPVSSAQLWIHIRNKSQTKLAQDILERLAKNKDQQWNIEQKPIQKVDDGPKKSQLRYFKRQDRQQAQKLLDTLRKWIPQIELGDISGKFDQVDWVKPGHYELWLSQDVMRLQ